MHDFFSQLWEKDFYNMRNLNNKSVLLVSGEIFSYKYPSGDIVRGDEYLQEKFLQHGAAECKNYILYDNDDDISKKLSSQYERGYFDIAVVIFGLEKEENPLVVLRIMRDLIATEGRLYILCRTPKVLYVKYALHHYEDIWRFSLNDFQNIFQFDKIIKTAFDTGEDFMILEIMKMVDKNMLPLDYPLFSCRVRGKIRPSKLKDKGYFNNFKELNVIGSKENTDKNRYAHNYLDKYEFFLHKWKDRKFNLLELGIFYGGSARMWKKYFTKADIHCVDIEPVCEKFAEERIITHIMDLGLEDNLKKLVTIKPEIIIDDASHLWTHQIMALFILFPVLPSGGVYIMEDLETSLNTNIFPGYGDGSEIDAYAVLERIAKVVASKVPDDKEDDYAASITQIGLQTELISLMKGSCVLIKR